MSLCSVSVPPPPAIPPSASAEPKPKPIRQCVHVRATYCGKSVQVDLEPVSQDVYTWLALKSKLQVAFGICNIRAKYADDAGDIVSIDSQEEFEEAIKVGNLLGSLDLVVDGDVCNPYIEQLHIRLSKPSAVQEEAMDTSGQSSSPESSFVESFDCDVPKLIPRVKYQPYQRTSGHYAELAHMIGSERGSAYSNKHVEAFHNKISKPFGAPRSEISTSNPHVEAIHHLLSKSGGKPQMPPTLARSPVTLSSGKRSPPGVSSASPTAGSAQTKDLDKNEYVEALHAKLLSMGSGGNGRQPVAPQSSGQMLWWISALDKTSDKITGEVHRGLEGTVEILTPPTGCTSLSSSNAVHYNIRCDGCEAVIKGARYKCGNCPDYDLCETCEQMSETIHRPDHVFLKIKIPATRAGVSKKGKPRPLLKRNIYQHTSHSSDEDECGEVKKHYRPRRHVEKAMPLMGGYVTRPKDKLKEEIKMRKREEKQRAKMESKVERLGAKLAATSVSSPKPASSSQLERKHQKGHGKYLDCQFITDTCYPNDSLVPFQVPFEKGWLVMNSGTKKWKHVKLIHTDGYSPLCARVDVPELKPGERIELVAKYPPITDSGTDNIKSSWRLVYKEATAFGPPLCLCVRVDKAPMIIYPPTIAIPPLTTPPTLPEKSLTNDNLLKSIGFIPGDSAPSAGDPSHSASPIGCGSEEEELLTTFDVVETPRELVQSLSSANSFNQFQETLQDFDEIKLDDTVSDDSDFVVILPDCFNLDKPLPGFSSVQSSVGDPTASIKSHDSQVTTLLDAASVKAELPTSHVTSTPPPVGGASPDTAQKANFVPERITLKQVKESRRYNPITVATGLVNTVTDLVDKRVHFGTRKATEVPPPSHDSSSSDSDDNFEDAPEAPCLDTMETTPTHPWKSGQCGDVRQLVGDDDSEDMTRWCHNPDVTHLLPLHWDGPKTPATPMERLIGMGFADRQLNAQLLDKHGNDLTSVLNELLDNHHQSFGGSSNIV